MIFVFWYSCFEGEFDRCVTSKSARIMSVHVESSVVRIKLSTSSTHGHLGVGPRRPIRTPNFKATVTCDTFPTRPTLPINQVFMPSAPLTMFIMFKHL